MRKPFLSIFLCVAIVGLFAGAALAAEETAPNAPTAGTPDMPQDPIAIKGSKKTVMFSHVQGHKDIECVVCHHYVNDKPSFAKCSDAGCHDDLTAKKGEKSLYFVMHNKSAELKHQSCMKCHAEIVAQKPDLKKALTGCTQSNCHPGDKAAAGAEKS